MLLLPIVLSATVAGAASVGLRLNAESNLAQQCQDKSGSSELYCADYETCCRLQSKVWACCMYKEGVCCKNSDSCCPVRAPCIVLYIVKLNHRLSLLRKMHGVFLEVAAEESEIRL